VNGADRVPRALGRRLTRISPVPLLVRAGIAVSVLVGFALAYPVQVLTGRPLAALAVVAVLPAVGPRRVWPTVAVLVTVAGWLVSTTGYGHPVTLWRLLPLAGSLYLTHTLCALAAVLPYDAVVDPEAVLRWLARAATVLLGTVVLAVPLVLLADAGTDTGSVAATVAGLLVAAAVSALPGWLLRRR
jgi:hypothetical protein